MNSTAPGAVPQLNDLPPQPQPESRFVLTVNGRTGEVSLTSEDVGLGNVLNVAQEPALGNPDDDGYVLISTAAGVRSWASLSVIGAGVVSINGQNGVVTLNYSDVGAQPADADLTAIAALSTTSFGRGFLPLSNESAARTYFQLGNVNNTSDVNKPVSTATQTALDSKADLVGGVVPSAQIPAIAITEFLGTVASQVAMLALSGQKGDWAIRSDTGSTWIITGTDPTQLASWTSVSYPGAPVVSVNGQTGAVTLSAADVGAQSLAGVLALGGFSSITGYISYSNLSEEVQQILESGVVTGSYPTLAGIHLDQGGGDIATFDPSFLILNHVSEDSYIRLFNGVQFYGNLSTSNLTANRSVSLPDASGTLAVTSNADGSIADNTVATAKLQNDAVTYAKMQNVSATSRVLGRKTAAAGDVEELSATDLTTILAASGGRLANTNLPLGPRIYDDAGTPKLAADLGEREFYYADGVTPAANFASGWLMDNAGTVVFAFNDYSLNDNNFNLSINFANRQLIAGDGSTVMIDWGTDEVLFFGGNYLINEDGVFSGSVQYVSGGPANTFYWDGSAWLADGSSPFQGNYKNAAETIKIVEDGITDGDDNVLLYHDLSAGARHQSTNAAVYFDNGGFFGIGSGLTGVSASTVAGVTDGSSAAAGKVGEYIAASRVVGSATALTTATPKTVTSISLTAGDWDVTAIGAITGASTGTVFDVAIGATTNSFTGTVLGDTRCQTPTVSLTGADASLMIPAVRISISSTTTYYLIVSETFTVGSPSAYGRISARRVR